MGEQCHPTLPTIEGWGFTALRTTAANPSLLECKKPATLNRRNHPAASRRIFPFFEGFPLLVLDGTFGRGRP